MKQISIVFSTHTTFNPFSSLIKWGLNIPFSHCSIRMTDGDTGQVVYYQASGLEVNCVTEEEFLNIETIVFRKDVQVSEKVYKTGKTFAIAQLGKPYGVPAIFGFAYQILMMKLFNKKVKNPTISNNSQWVCSQLAAGYVEACENIQLDISNMSPLALYQVMPTLPDVWN